MLRSLGGKCQHNAGAEQYFNNALVFYVELCKHPVLFQKFSFPGAACVCSRGTSLTLAVFDPIQLPGLPC